MLKVFKWLKERITFRIWAWIHAFLALGLGWGHAIALFPPIVFNGVLDPSLVFRMGLLTAIGAIVAVIGMFMTRSLRPSRQHKGLWIELVGTVLLFGGPFQYFAIQVGFLLTQEPDIFRLRYALMWFAYSLVAFVIVRFAIILPALIEASNTVKQQRRAVS